MNKTDKVFVEILSEYINGRKCDITDFSDVDIERLKELVTIHKLMGIYYSCLKDSDIDKNLLQQLEMGFYGQLASYQRRSMVKEKLKKLFDSNEIHHIWIKGSYIADKYPDPELRSMSDLDIIIEKKDKEKLHQLLLAEGAEYMHEVSESTVRVYKFCGVNLEMHTGLVSAKQWMNGVDFSEYFSDVFSHKVPVGGCSYILEEEYNIVYTIFHIAKHFYGSGCGIRMLLDLPVLIRNSEDISWKNVWKELEKIKLAGFATRIFMLCEEWFGEFGVRYDKKHAFNNKEIIEDYIIEGGVYGFAGRNIDAVKIKYQGSNKEGGYSYLKGMFRWAFPTCKDMRQYSLWFHDKPAVLLPVAYVERFIRNARERGGIIKWSKSIAASRKDLDEKEIILNVMDLK